MYRILLGKRPWALAVQRQKSEGGRLRELPGAYQGTFMRQLTPRLILPGYDC